MSRFKIYKHTHVSVYKILKNIIYIQVEGWTSVQPQESVIPQMGKGEPIVWDTRERERKLTAAHSLCQVLYKWIVFENNNDQQVLNLWCMPSTAQH